MSTRTECSVECDTYARVHRAPVNLDFQRADRRMEVALGDPNGECIRLCFTEPNYMAEVARAIAEGAVQFKQELSQLAEGD